jgi:hypothetical protein
MKGATFDKNNSRTNKDTLGSELLASGAGDMFV